MVPEHQAFLAAQVERVRAKISEGGLIEASLRAVYYIGALLGSVDERQFNLVRQLRAQHNMDVDAVSVVDFKKAIREQAEIMRLDPAKAISALPQLLSRAASGDIREMSAALERVLTASGPLEEAAQTRLEEIKAVFNASASCFSCAPHVREKEYGNHE